MAPLTIIIGRNNSGKSSLIQSLLLLKQTLADPRRELMIHLDGIMEALNLRELTFGRPPQASEVDGPIIELEWESTVDISAAIEAAYHPELVNLTKHSGVSWFSDPPDEKVLRTLLRIETVEIEGAAEISSLVLRSLNDNDPPMIRIARNESAWECYWRGTLAKQIEVQFDHFIPYLKIDRSKVGPRERQRVWQNAFTILFSQPLESLKSLLHDLHYLGALRSPPPSLYRPATASPSGIGVSGEFAAQLLHRRQKDVVHYPAPITVSDSGIQIKNEVYAAPLVEAVNKTLESLSVDAPLRVEEIADVGFRLLFGEAGLAHVGRGLNNLLPLVELGLFADPLRFTGNTETIELSDYVQQCGSYSHLALEEPEAHLHPKAASRLAHWFVSLARANRRLIVETHSDHLVRRLRGLAARAGTGTELEQWLLNNVVIVNVEQEDGVSHVTSSHLTAEGGVAENWPTDFMDESTDEESAIYYAKLEKSAPRQVKPSVLTIIDGTEPEPQKEP